MANMLLDYYLLIRNKTCGRQNDPSSKRLSYEIPTLLSSVGIMAKDLLLNNDKLIMDSSR